MKAKQSALVAFLIRKGKKHFAARKTAAKVAFTGNPDADALLNDLRRTPHAFVLGCVMDQQIKAHKAWAIPHEVAQSLGSFSMDKLKARRCNWYVKLFNRKGLHRFNDVMADYFYRAVQDIAKKYDGDASRIWRRKPSSAAVVYRFLEFKGVGPKIATMAPNILARDFRVKFSDYMSVDISADVHVKRVFKRMGLVPASASNDMVIYKARELHPPYPGIFDYACWKIGVDFCKPQAPLCEKCTARKLCEKII